MKDPEKLRPFETFVRIDGEEKWHETIYAFSRSKARYDRWLGLREAWPDSRLMDVQVRGFGRQIRKSPVRQEQFEALERTAKYRGVPFVRHGMKVVVGEWHGVIAGQNSSANFEVAFSDGPHAGLTLNCHPNWEIAYFDEQGNVLADFRKGARA